jgi:hypothetical protein
MGFFTGLALFIGGVLTGIGLTVRAQERMKKKRDKGKPRSKPIYQIPRY